MKIIPKIKFQLVLTSDIFLAIYLWNIGVKYYFDEIFRFDVINDFIKF